MSEAKSGTPSSRMLNELHLAKGAQPDRLRREPVGVVISQGI